MANRPPHDLADAGLVASIRRIREEAPLPLGTVVRSCRGDLETIIAKAREHQVDVVGLSGLLVKSAIVMQESMPQYEAAGLKTPILLGGAALTRKFVAESCVPSYSAPPMNPTVEVTEADPA